MKRVNTSCRWQYHAIIGVVISLISMNSSLRAATQTMTGNVLAGQAKASACAACHGAKGNTDVAQWPKLAGQHEAYLITQLQAFRQGSHGERNNPVMYGIASGLTDQDIADLSAYYASLPALTGSADPKLVTAGEALYRGGDKDSNIPACIACHGPSGQGNAGANYPMLAGQNADYTVLQLQAFRSGMRSNDTNAVMREIASRMSEAQMRAVASYIAGLHATQ